MFKILLAMVLSPIALLGVFFSCALIYGMIKTVAQEINKKRK